MCSPQIMENAVIRYLATIVAVLVCALASAAQTNTPPTHQHNATPVVDGATNPDGIPDAVAYRLCMVAFSVSQTPTETERNRQNAQLAHIGLGKGDQQALAGIIADFKAKHDALIAEYNAMATAAAAHNETTDGAILMAKLDDLVQTTRNTIATQLSAQGVSRLRSFVVGEKKSMKVQGE
jgi:hypothetical protein